LPLTIIYLELVTVSRALPLPILPYLFTRWTQQTHIFATMNWKWLSFLALPAINNVKPRWHSSCPLAAAVSSGPQQKNSNQATNTAAAASTVNSMKSVRNLAVAGRIPWKKLILTKAQGLKVLSIMRAETHPLDVAIVFILSVFPERIGRFV